MNRQLAWTLTLVAGAWSVDQAQGQVANPPPSRKAASAGAGAAAPAKAARTPAEQAADDARKREADLRAVQAMNPILAEWEKRSVQTTSLDAVFDKIEHSPFGDQWSRGRAMLQSPDKACLQFTLYKLDPNNKPIVNVDPANNKKVAVLEKQPEKRIVCTGTEVLQYVWENKTVTIYPLDKQVRMKALQEGPLPFLFNMKAAEAKQRYGMKLFKEFEKEYVIDIEPREEVDRDSFMQARLWLNKENFLPNKLILVMNGGKEWEEYMFNGANDVIMANQTMDPKWFSFQVFDGWKKVVNKGDLMNKAAAPGQGALIAPQPRQQATQGGGRPTSR